MGFELVHRTVDERFLLCDGLPVQQQPFPEARRRADHQVDAGHEPRDVRLADILGDGLDFEERVQLAQTARGHLHARAADGVVGHEQLPVEVARPDRPGVGQDETTNAGGRELVRRRPADAADARHQHRRAFQPLLPRGAEAGHPHLPLVDGFFRLRQRPLLTHERLHPSAA